MSGLKFLFLILLLIVKTSLAQDTVAKVDLKQYSGKWFVIAATPGAFDKEWNFITESCSLDESGNVDIVNTYIKLNKSAVKTVNSRGIPKIEKNNFEWNLRSSPGRSDYLIEEVSPGYTHAIIGDPEKKYFYILSRSPTLPDDVYKQLLGRSKKKGYNISEVRKIPQ